VEQRREHWVERHHRFLRVGIGNVPQSLIVAFFSGRGQKTWSLHSPLGLPTPSLNQAGRGNVAAPWCSLRQEALAAGEDSAISHCLLCVCEKIAESVPRHTSPATDAL